MRIGRIRRWGRVGFLRRRLPYVLDVVMSRPRTLLFWSLRPRLWLDTRHRVRLLLAGRGYLDA